MKESEKREAQLQEQILGWQKEQEVQRAELEQQNARIEKLHLELANAGQKEEFAGQNLKRIEKEISVPLGVNSPPSTLTRSMNFPSSSNTSTSTFRISLSV